MNQQMQKDHAAFARKAASRYETRADPDMGSLARSIEAIGEGFEEFKRKQEERVDLLETRLSRPGVMTAPGSKTAAAKLIDVKTGRQLHEIKSGDSIDEIKAKLQRDDRGAFSDEFRDLTIGDWFRAVAGQRSSELALKSLSVGTDTAGGHLVPVALMPGILAALTASSSLTQAGSRVIPVEFDGGGAKTFTWAAVNAIPTAAWRNENGNVAESDPSFRTVVATPRSLAFYFKVSRELLADAANLETAIPQLVGQAMAVELDRAGLMGSGSAPEPRGIKNTSGIQAVSNGTNGASLATTKFANLMTAIQSILTANGPIPTAAIMAPRSLIGFGNLADSTGQPLQRPDLLRNLRMIATSQIPVNLSVGTSTDCTDVYVGNFDRTAWVIREQVSIQRLNEAFATTGQVGFLVHLRGDFIAEYPATLALISGVRP